MENLPTVIVRPGEADRILAGHPWIYHGSILRLTAPAQDGDIVQVKDHRARFLGVGFYNSKSKINVRLISPERLEVDRQFFEVQLKKALEWRRKHLPNATSFRLVNSESDFLSGLIVDKYEDVLVLQASSLGMDLRKGLVVDVLESLLSPRAIIERSDVTSRKYEGLENVSGLLRGAFEGEMKVNLNGLRFATNLLGGHKTGLYLDQQTNYLLVETLVRETKAAQILDCFSFMGGFTLHAARGGAGHVHALDQSEEANAHARRNAEENGLGDRCSFETVNVFDWLKQKTHAPPGERPSPSYDLVILDPPSFTRNRAAIPDALRGYKEIHLRALKLLKPGGTLVTFCCSHHVNSVMFQEVILEAAFDARRVLRRTATYSQAPDHPIVPAIPETEYLKGFAFELAR